MPWWAGRPPPKGSIGLTTVQDDLIERLGGPGAVAEMTGRSKRFVKGSDGTYK